MSKASGGDGIAVGLYKILKDDAVKVLYSICQQIWKTQQWPQDRTGRFHCNSQERWFQRMFDYHTVALITLATKVIFPSKSSTVHELWNSICSSWSYKRQWYQRSNCQYLLDDRKSKRIPEKNIYFCFTDSAKAFDSDHHNKLWKILEEMGLPDHLCSPEKPVCRSGSNS